LVVALAYNRVFLRPFSSRPYNNRHLDRAMWNPPRETRNQSVVLAPNNDTPRLFSKQASYPAENAVLLWIIRMVFARNLENRRESGRIGIDSVSYFIGNLERDLEHEAMVKNGSVVQHVG
jgi:hypothetical protein